MTTIYECKSARIIDGRIYGLKVTTVRQVTNDQKETVKDLKMTVDFDAIPVDELAKFATATLIIRRQNGVWKKQTPEQIKQDNGKTIKWDSMGTNGSGSNRPSMAATLANIMIANGVPEDKAIERASDIAKDPAKLKVMLEMAGMLS